jgi:hypothetical protein
LGDGRKTVLQNKISKEHPEKHNKKLKKTKKIEIKEKKNQKK